MLPTPDITSALENLERGVKGAEEALVQLIYDDLRRIARNRLRASRPGRTLDTTGLVHEAFLKMMPLEKKQWRGRDHFMAASAQAMRHVLVDAARRRVSAKRGSGQEPETLDDEAFLAVDEEHATQVLWVDTALQSLSDLEPRLTRVVECLFFAGMTEQETGEALGVSSRTVHRDWLRARGWLRAELSPPTDSNGAKE